VAASLFVRLHLPNQKTQGVTPEENAAAYQYAGRTWNTRNKMPQVPSKMCAENSDLQKMYPRRWRNWARITPFFNYPLDIRKAIYTTNSVESLNGSLREIIKTRGGFANEEAALKSLFLALRQAAKKWTMPIHHWREALNHFTILWPERMPALERVAS
jgi:Transposase, Mutator family